MKLLKLFHTFPCLVTAISVLVLGPSALLAQETQSDTVVPAGPDDPQAQAEPARTTGSSGGATDSTAETTDSAAVTDDSATGNPDSNGAAKTAAAVTTAQLLAMLNRQQDQLDKQKGQLDKHKGQIDEQNKLIQSWHAKGVEQFKIEKDTIAKQAKQIDDQRQTIVVMQGQIDQMTQKSADELSKSEVELRARLETLESSIKTSRDGANTAFKEGEFPNSSMIPGTSAAWRMGGFVKMNIVETFDPLGSLDRFIAGSIPVPQETSTPRTSMTVSQSRLNWDLRDRTKYGTMRAYIEGDFAGDDEENDDTFRLRHAFGQFKDVLAGKTWSVFQDMDAAPEEIDFEGINGAVNVRQAQVRYFPNIAQDWDLMFSLEDPNPEVTGGTATSQIPDILASARRTWFDRWHVKTSVVLRQLTAVWDEDETESKATAWGVSVSGKTATNFWNPSGQDNFMFQLNVGEGIGRYINDLNTAGGNDAIFTDDGKLETLPVFAGYLAYQHWWNQSMRSTMNLSWVDVDNNEFQPDEAYQKTLRTAVNYIYSPTARVDLGAELIWGSRENKDDERASAAQIQLSTKYRF